MTPTDQEAWDEALAELRNVRDREPGVLDVLANELTSEATFAAEKLGDRAQDSASARLLVGRLCRILAHEGEPPA